MKTGYSKSHRINGKLRRYLAASLALFLWAFVISDGGSTYHTTRPFLVLSGGTAVLALAGQVWKRWNRGFLIAVLIVHLILWIPCLYPATEWPGGDDGSGMAWFWFLGAGCLVAIPLAVKNLVWLRKQKKANSQLPAQVNPD